MPGIGLGLSPMFSRGLGVSAPVPFGQLFTDNYQRGALGANYTSNLAPSIISNQLNIPDGGGSFANYIAYSGYGHTNLNSWTQVVDWICPSVAALSFLGIGIRGTQSTSPNSSQCGLLIQAGGTGCLARIYINGTLLGSGGSITCVAGNIMRSTITFNGATYTSTHDNITLSTQATVTATAVTSGGAGTIHGQGYYALCPYAGNFTVTNWSSTTAEYKYADYAFIGDSITQIFSASAVNNCFAIKVGVAKSKIVLKLGGTNNITQDILNSLPETIAFRAKKPFLMIGGNDILYSVASGTWQANMNSIISQLAAVGMPVTNLLATPRTSTDIRPINTYLTGLATPYIDTYTPLWSGTSFTANPTYYAADLVHPNDAGHTLLTTTITAAIP